MFKFCLILVLLVPGLPGALQAEALDDLKQAYLARLAEEPRNGELLGELAILEAKSQNLGLARGYNLAAVRLDPGSRSNKMTWDYLKNVPELQVGFTTSSFWQALYQMVGLWVSFWPLTLFLVLVFTASVWMWIKTAGRRRRALRTGGEYQINWLPLAGVGILQLGLFLVWSNKLVYEVQQRGVLISSAPLRSGAMESSPEFNLVTFGQEVRILKSHQDWQLVELRSGQVGWVKAPNLFVLPRIKLF